MMYDNHGLDCSQVEYIVELMRDLYKYELIFQDFKRHEFTLNDNDEKFVIPYRNKLNQIVESLYDLTKYGERLHKMTIREVEKTWKNKENVEKLIQYAIFCISKEN